MKVKNLLIFHSAPSCTRPHCVLTSWYINIMQLCTWRKCSITNPDQREEIKLVSRRVSELRGLCRRCKTHYWLTRLEKTLDEWTDLAEGGVRRQKDIKTSRIFTIFPKTRVFLLFFLFHKTCNQSSPTKRMTSNEKKKLQWNSNAWCSFHTHGPGLGFLQDPSKSFCFQISFFPPKCSCTGTNSRTRIWLESVDVWHVEQ